MPRTTSADIVWTPPARLRKPTGNCVFAWKPTERAATSWNRETQPGAASHILIAAPSSGIVQACRNAVNRRPECIVEFFAVRARPFAPQEIDLDQAHGIDVWIP